MTIHTQVSANPPQPVMNKPLRIADISLDTARYRVWRAGREVNLTTREFHVLALLMSQPGRVFTRDEILDHVWGAEAEISGRNVDACVKRLRRALLHHGRGDPIRTVRMVGYAFDELYGR